MAPPGQDKMVIARHIGKIFNARNPKVTSEPKILSMYLRQSEGNIRKLFADAEWNYEEKAEDGGLHILIFDVIPPPPLRFLQA